MHIRYYTAEAPKNTHRVPGRLQSSVATAQIFQNHSSTTSPLLRSLSTPDKEAVVSLFHNYFSIKDSTYGQVFVSWLPKMIPSGDDDPFSAAFWSAGHGLLFGITKCPQQLAVAREKYCRAIYLTRNTLQNSDPSKTSWILRIIMLLGLFEVHISFHISQVIAGNLKANTPKIFTCTSYASLNTYSRHLDGAATLVATRGLELTNGAPGAVGLKVFLHFRSRMVCIKKNAEVCYHLIRL
jgi:hypothetical protein